MVENINLGDKSKFVPYGTNGVKNCLDLCKMILKKYGLTNFGSSANIFRLIYEKDGKLSYYGDNPTANYQRAIECIDRHLENDRPIIVGVNHTIGRNINEGTTDHFVVIYGREYIDKYHIAYFYYEVGKSNVMYGYNDKDNRFIYDTSNSKRPQFYDEISSRNDGVRFDVTQVRPND
jgi:hypothetical protein